MRALIAACVCAALVAAGCAPARVSVRASLPHLAAEATPNPEVAQAPQAAGAAAESGTAADSERATGADGSAHDASAPDPTGARAAPVAQDESAPATDGNPGSAGASDSSGHQANAQAVVAAGASAADRADSEDASADGAVSLDGEAAGSRADAADVALEPAARQTMGGAGLGRAAVAVPAPATLPVLSGLLDGLLPDEELADYGLVLEDLSTGARTGINGSQTFPSASLYKLGLAWIALRQVDAGGLSLDAPITIEDTDTVEPEPDGGFGEGDTPTLREALAGMLSISSNAAAHALLRMIGRDAFAEEMDRLGMTQTRVPDDGLATTSADDMAHLLRLIATSSELSPASRELIAQDMAGIAPPDALRDSLPDTVGIFDKTGNLDDASNVGALLQSSRATAILVVIDTGVNPGDARGIIAQVGMIAYRALLQ